MLDYALVAGLLLYFLMVKIAPTVRLHPTVMAVVVVGGMTGFSLLIRWIVSSDAAHVRLFDPMTVMTAILQFIAAAVVFHKLQDGDESYAAWALWTIGGCMAIFFVIPALLGRILP